MIEISNLSVKYNDLVLDDVNLIFKDDAIYGVIGKSGSGKTTLLKTIAGLIDFYEGEIRFEGKIIVGPKNRLIPGYDEIQLVNQDFGLDLYHTVYENVKEKILSRDKKLQKELIDEFLELVELTSIKDRKAKLLSGGEQQRLSIARALACEPKVLLLDEPFVHLDQRLRWKILQYLKKIKSEFNLLIVLVSHDGAEIMGFADRIIHVENKVIVREDIIKNIYYSPESKSQAELMGEINEIEIEGETVLFRPNEYSLENTNFNVKFDLSTDIGMVVLNYFYTDKKERILLTSREEMKGVTKIRIKR